ncbi:coiled-coil domain-containing protein [Paenibacillus sp. 8b26]|uniref:coiled-coil domain-containing protein n=1 Tax=Paenibacillus sp. 8b26 TaxID=3424133 RepID=UPI003D661858
MGTIYSKYSRERAPEYQIKTSIHQDEFMYVSKTALTDQAVDHIKRIYSNYEILKPVYHPNKLAKPLSYELGSVLFEYLEGKSLDQLVLEAVINKERKLVYEILDVFSNFLETVAEGYYCEFNNTPEFISVFGKKVKLEGLNSFTIANIDLNLDNILMDNDNQLSIIDYEWVYPFPIPLNFIKFRAINSFYYSHYASLQNFIHVEDIFSYVGVSKEEIPDYIDMANKFADIVGTEKELLSLQKYLKKAIPFKFTESVEYRAQLFISSNQEFSEDKSFSFEIKEPEQTIVCDLFQKGQISCVRFDPMEGRGIIRIGEARLIDLEDNIVQISEFSSNADWIGGGYYVFLDSDPQIYYQVENKEYKRIEFSTVYIEEFPEGLMKEVLKKSNSLQNEILINQRNISSQEEKISELVVEKNELLDTLNEMGLNLSIVKENLSDKVEEINVLNHKLDSSNQEISSLHQEIHGLQRQMQELTFLLTSREQTINDMTSTRWWKIRLFCKRIFRKNVD